MRRRSTLRPGVPASRPLPKSDAITRSRRLAGLKCPVCGAQFLGAIIPRHGRSGEPLCPYEQGEKLPLRMDEEGGGES